MIMNTVQHVQMHGILNAIKTGDPTVDAMVSVAVPLALTTVLGKISSRASFLTDIDNTFVVRWLRGNAFTRTIKYRCYQHSNASTTNLDSDSRNQYLVRAIKLYIHQKCNLNVPDAEVDLSDIGKRKADGSLFASTKAMLSYCEIILKPVQRKWNCIGIFEGSQVWIWISDSTAVENTGGGGSSTEQKIRTVVVKLSSSTQSSVDMFIRDALEYYKGQLATLETTYRYFFDVVSFTASDRPLYNSYKLSGEKTFDTIFSQQAKKLVKIVDDFQSKRGKYGVAGFPYKLGILLHGPPGTGKTSLIKALAHYTNRHIVNVPLTRLTKNQELEMIFFKRDFSGAAGDLGGPTKPAYDQLIFVLEDVDAQSKVVTARKKKATKKDESEEQEEQDEKENEIEDPVAEKKSEFAMPDALSLSGMLNVFDGIVATPGRVSCYLRLFAF